MLSAEDEKEGTVTVSARETTFLIAIVVVLSSHKPSWRAAGFSECFLGLAYSCASFVFTVIRQAVL